VEDEDTQQEHELEANEDMKQAIFPRTPEQPNPLAGFDTSDILPYSPSESPKRLESPSS
jgi:hypothetical protein